MPQPNEQDPIEEAVGGEDKAAEALKIARDLEERLKNSGNSNQDIDPADLINTPDFKSKAKELTGMTDAQVDFVIKTANAASAAANEVAAVAEIRSRHPDFSKFEKSIRDELKNYPPDKRGNMSIVEKLYFVEKGKEAEKNPGRGDDDRGRRPSLRGSGPTGEGLDSGKHGSSGADSLDADERYVARRMGITDQQYAKSKTTKLINDLIESK